MRVNWIWSGLVAGTLSVGTMALGEDPSISPDDGVIALFNGSDFTGLYTWLVDARREDPRRVFTVTNGWIRVSGEGLGYLATERRYHDYVLVVEFRWGDRNWEWGDRVGRARDSGVFLHSVGPDGNSFDGQGAFRAAIECNVFEGATGDFLLIRGSGESGEPIEPQVTAEVAERRDEDGWFYWKEGGRRQVVRRWGRINWVGKSPGWMDVTGFRGPDDVESRAGEWTRLECRCAGDTIEVRVNGKLVNRVVDVSPDRGKILLQCEGSEIFFRKFELHPLSR